MSGSNNSGSSDSQAVALAVNVEDANKMAIEFPGGETPPSCSRKLRKYSFLILLNKYILYAVNCFIWLGGLLLVAFGVWARVEDSSVGYLQLLPFDPVALLIALGSLSVVISFFGCVGSVRENVLLLKVFCGAIGCLFVVELASCIVGFVSVNSIKDAVIAKFSSSMELYDEDDQIRGLVDRIQKDYQCCGAVGPSDWDRNVYYNCTASFNVRQVALNPQQVASAGGYVNLPSACGVPSSCCRSAPIIESSSYHQSLLLSPPNAGKQPYYGGSTSNNNNNNAFASFPGFPINDQCGFGIRRLQASEQAAEIFMAGCADHMTESLSQNLLYVAIVALAISCFELISILLAFMLIRRVTTVIEFMAYIQSGRFVEVDPTRMPHSSNNNNRRNNRHHRRHRNNHSQQSRNGREQQTTQQQLQNGNVPLQVVVTNESLSSSSQNNRSAANNNNTNAAEESATGQSKSRKRSRSRDQQPNNRRSSAGSSASSASNVVVALPVVENLRDIHI